ncbi:hypothetical protein [Devosia aurantiaca]|uniref:Uncharacterized protein n=1 Tax=Devosia aurantiaca TaxID=2714858 RepID=A0A6M1SV90_9HYPH|nr:hypothetical protein [Devosia aurantiaca]NGP19312.1 hypothetical protein [Devosia aurantiaca]
MILDGFNNPGYSGAPIFIQYQGQVVPFGVVSAYRHEVVGHSSVYKLIDGEEQALPDTYVKPNSGMIYAHYWDRVTRLLPKLNTRNPTVAEEDMQTTIAEAEAIGWTIRSYQDITAKK